MPDKPWALTKDEYQSLPHYTTSIGVGCTEGPFYEHGVVERAAQRKLVGVLAGYDDEFSSDNNYLVLYIPRDTWKDMCADLGVMP